MAILSAAFCEEYLKTFRVRLVDTDELQREAQRLRYQVYSIENDFEPRNSEGLEHDVYDERAPHALLFHNELDEPLGTVRLVLPDARQAEGSLPIHGVCPPDLFTSADLPTDRTGEISRFALSKVRFQRLVHRAGPAAPGHHDDSRRALSFACLGLITAVRQIASMNGITHVAAIMKPALLRRFQLLGLSFDQVHSPINHHGWRVPCFTRIERLEGDVQRQRPDLWGVFSERMAA